MPEQIQKIIDVVNETKAKEAEEFHQIIVQEKAKRKGQWDVKSTDKIEYFDSRLSYEVIGYKPIDKTRGLDFNPSWFMEARDTFEKATNIVSIIEDLKLMMISGLRNIKDVEMVWKVMVIELLVIITIS